MYGGSMLNKLYPLVLDFWFTVLHLGNKLISTFSQKQTNKKTLNCMLLVLMPFNLLQCYTSDLNVSFVSAGLGATERKLTVGGVWVVFKYSSGGNPNKKLTYEVT